MSSEIIYRKALPADTYGICNFITENLGKGSVPRTLEYWRWKHENNPFGPSYVLIAEYQNRIVGLRAFLNWKFRWNNKTISAVRAVDTATHQQWRRRGIFSNLTKRMISDLAKEEVDFIFNTPNKKSRAGYLKMGWKNVCKVPIYLKINSNISTLKAAFSKNENEEWIKNADYQYPKVGEALNDVYSAYFVMTTNSTQKNRKISTGKTASYLRWRYAKIPGMTYRVAYMFDGKSGVIIIFRLRLRNGFREVSFSEVFVTDNNETVKMGCSLIRDLSKNIMPQYITAALPTHCPEHKLIRRAGFFPFPIPGPNFIVRELKQTSSIPNIDNWDNWNLTVGDLEVF